MLDMEEARQELEALMEELPEDMEDDDAFEQVLDTFCARHGLDDEASMPYAAILDEIWSE